MQINDDQRKLIERALQSHAELCLRDIAATIGPATSDIFSSVDAIFASVQSRYYDALAAITLAKQLSNDRAQAAATPKTVPPTNPGEIG